MNNRLKEIRRAAGLTQKEFAERLEVNQPLVAKWENGTQPIPPQQIKLICHEFEIRLEWLRDGEGEMEKPTMTYREILIEKACATFETLTKEEQDAAIDIIRHFKETGKWESRW